MAAHSVSFIGESTKKINHLHKSISGKATTSVILCSTTVVLNQIGEREYFTCPEKGYVTAGVIFMIMPGLVLAVLVLLGSRKVAKGCSSPGEKHCCHCWLIVLVEACAYSTQAFLSWLVATLMLTDTLSCIYHGPAPKGGNATEIMSFKSKQESMNAQSNAIGCYLLVGIVIILSIVVYINRACCLTERERFTDLSR